MATLAQNLSSFMEPYHLLQRLNVVDVDFNPHSDFRDLMSDRKLVAVCVILNIFIARFIYQSLVPSIDLPVVGYPTWLGSYYGALKFYYNSEGMIREGYEKFKATRQAFKVPRMTKWAVIVTEEKQIDELHHLPDNVLSLLESAKDELQVPYTMGWTVQTNPYHLPILRTKLPRYLDYLIKEVMDEIIPTFEAEIRDKCTNSDWNDFNATTAVTNIVSRSFNRILVGAPLCRSREYNDIACEFTAEAVVISMLINFFPKFLHPVVGNIFKKFFSSVNRRASRYLVPLIEERKQHIRELGADYPEKPADFLTWLIDAAEGPDSTTESLATRILVVNAATIHTSSLTFTQALCNLAARPEYIEPLRREAEESLRLHGYNKAGMYHLPKMDSFFKESIRYNGLGTMGFPRKALKTFTFSDGLEIPKGTYVSAAFCCHYDEQYYPNPLEFDGYRFLDKEKLDEYGPGGNGSNAMASTNSHYLPFGHGRHPGRFLVSYMVKALMVQFIMNYDMKLGGDGKKKSDLHLEYIKVPSRTARILLRRRAT